MPMIPRVSAIAPAIPSMTRVKEVRASDLPYTSCIVRTDANGRFAFTDHTVARTSLRRLCLSRCLHRYPPLRTGLCRLRGNAIPTRVQLLPCEKRRRDSGMTDQEATHG